MTEEDAVSLAQRGDEKGFRALYERHFGRIFRLALRYMRSPEDAEDVAQETFIKAYSGLDSFDIAFGAGFSAWLNRICVNCAIDHCRKARRLAGKGLVALDDLPHEPASPGPSPEDKAISADALSTLGEMVDNLSPRQRVIFALRYGQHLDIKQIAGRLECSEGNVRLHLFRSTLKLRHCYAEASAS